MEWPWLDMRKKDLHAAADYSPACITLGVSKQFQCNRRSISAMADACLLWIHELCLSSSKPSGKLGILLLGHCRNVVHTCCWSTAKRHPALKCNTLKFGTARFGAPPSHHKSQRRQAPMPPGAPWSTQTQPAAGALYCPVVR
eukprot:scaffold201021_cov14-Tisochrysis_lutea.AAC.1